MTGRAHETAAFQNAVTYSVTVTYTIAGGARRGTAERRAVEVAERLANTAARIPSVVEATATVGRSMDGQLIAPQRVRFAKANTGHGAPAEPGKLDRYLDPEHERALASLAAADAAWRARRDADRRRRLAVGCRNTSVLSPPGGRSCPCVYCCPEEHTGDAGLGRAAAGLDLAQCLCGVLVGARGLRCPAHRDVELVVLDDDPVALHELAATQRPQASDESPNP